MCSVFPASIWMACGRTSITDWRASTAPDGLPGRFRTKDVPQTPQTPRLNRAKGVFFSPSRRIRSATPSSILPQTERVASGVTSRAEMPVPPVVTTSRAFRASSTIAFWIPPWSSATTLVSVIAKWCSCRVRATAGPDRSLRSPRAQESLTVRTAARKVSGVEEDILFLLTLATAVTPGLVQQSQPFHEQALGIQCGGLLLGFAVEVDLEVAPCPTQDFEHCGIARQRTVNSVSHLPLTEVHLTFVVVFSKREQAALASHFERLH